MIDCRPLGLFSWDFELISGTERSRLGFTWPTEGGWISVDSGRLSVVKSGFFSGTWELSDKVEVLATGRKPSAFTRTFEIRTASGDFSLDADSPFSRIMLLRGPGTDAVIRPDHPFTRRASIRGPVPDLITTSFAFWLAALTWRRAANSAAAS